MEQVKVQIMKMAGSEDIPAPAYMSEHSAGMDICAAVSKTVSIAPGERVLIPTGIAISLPVGFEAQIRPRSGLALKYGISLLNAPGTIDADYRGEIKVILINHGSDAFMVARGERIAQMIINKVYQACWEHVDELDITVRGAGGFGHTSR